MIKEFGANMEKTKVHLLGVEKGNGTTLTRIHDPSKIETHPVSIDYLSPRMVFHTLKILQRVYLLKGHIIPFISVGA